MPHLRLIITVFLSLLPVLLAGCIEEKAKTPLQLGDPAPDFAAKTLEGDVVVLSSLKGKPVLLRFFETGCRFCRADTPAVQGYVDKAGRENLHVLYVGSFYDSSEALRSFVQELGLDFPVAEDNGARLADLYEVKAYPQTFFIGPDGAILAAVLGAVGEAELGEVFGRFLQ